MIEISEELLKLPKNNVTEIFEKPDDIKLKSCMTLFSMVSEYESLFDKAICKFFNGKYDSSTILKLRKN